MAKAFFPPDAKHSGVDIEYYKRRRELVIGGWYDSFVGIKPTTVTLKEFFHLLGISKADCIKAFEEEKEER